MQSWINCLGLRLPDVSISAHRESIQLQPPNPTHSLHFLEILCHYRARHRCILRLFAAKYNVYLVIFLKYEDSSMKMCSKWHMCNKYVNLVLILFFFSRRENRKAKPCSKSVPTSWTVCRWQTSIRSTTGCHTKRSGLKSGPCVSNDTLDRPMSFLCVQNYYYYFFYAWLLFLILSYLFSTTKTT